MNDEEQIKNLVERWAAAAQRHDMDEILAWHHPDIVMYDVPPPFQSVGIDAYKVTWELFLSGLEKGPDAFRVIDLTIMAGADVAFCFSPMKCVYRDIKLNRMELDFRLTIGLRKIDGQWWFVHEHHSVPSVE